MQDLNQNLKRKYIKKNVDYKKVLRGEFVDAPQNFFQQFVLNIKSDLNNRPQMLSTQKITSEPSTQLEEEEYKDDADSMNLAEQKTHIHQKLRKKKMDQLEVKTISERSQEDSVEYQSIISSKGVTPIHHSKNFLSGSTIQKRLQSEVKDLDT